MGRNSIVKCLLNGLETDALWDTGAISHSWLNQSLSGCDIRDIAELLGMDGLKLKAANGTDLPYEGWVELTFKVHLTPKFFFGRDEPLQHSHKEFDNIISIWYF